MNGISLRGMAKSLCHCHVYGVCQNELVSFCLVSSLSLSFQGVGALLFQTFPTERALPEPNRSFHQSLRPSSGRYDAGLIQTRLDDNPSAKQMLFKILDLVDRYWNGSKSLHQHAKFLSK